jgi:hypothetical protein
MTDIEQLRRLVSNWTGAAMGTELEHGEGDRYARGLLICAEQLTEIADSIERDRENEQ